MAGIGLFLACLTKHCTQQVNEKGCDAHRKNVDKVSKQDAGMLHNLRKYRLCGHRIRADVKHIDITIGMKCDIE